MKQTDRQKVVNKYGTSNDVDTPFINPKGITPRNDILDKHRPSVWIPSKKTNGGLTPAAQAIVDASKK